MQPETHIFFRLSDGDYCHVLDDKLVFSAHKAIRDIDEMKEKRKGLVKLGIAAVAFGILMFFSRRVLVDIYMNAKGLFFGIVAFVISVFIFAYIGIINQKLVILRSEIINITYRKRGIGYSYFLIEYNSNGKLRSKKVKLYDEPLAEQHAVNVMREAGLLKG